MLTIRPIEERDMPQVPALYHAAYGGDYPFGELFDTHWIRKAFYGDDTIWLVAEQGEGRLVGSAAALLATAGERDDLVGEVGRLVVHPEARGAGVAERLVAALIGRAEEALEFGFAEARTAHTASQKMLLRQGFAVAGLEPAAYRFRTGRESVVFMARLFGDARKLRRTNPRVIPAIHALGSLALANLGLDDDLLVEPAVEPYPSSVAPDWTLTELEPTEWHRVRRLDRARADEPLVFGSIRLDHGWLRLRAHDARYLVLRRGPTVAGGIGYTWDAHDAKVRVFEMLAADERARGTLLERAVAHVEALHAPEYLTIDVNAHAPRLQQTLHNLGFAAVAYAPAMVYESGERLDVVRMAKLRVPFRADGLALVPEARAIARCAGEAVAEQARGVGVGSVARGIQIFQGLTERQLDRVEKIGRIGVYEPGEHVVERGGLDRSLFAVLDGAVEIRLDAGHVVAVGPGEVFGELALVDALPRSATAICTAPARLLEIAADDFHALTRHDTVLAATLYRNLAVAIGRRLRAWSGGVPVSEGPRPALSR